MLHIEGFAAPYRQPNAYNETFATAAFAGKLEPCPILLMHEPHMCCGRWEQIWEDHAGVWVRGKLFPGVEPYAEELLAKLPELSVSWQCSDGSRKSRMWRELMGKIREQCVVGPGDLDMPGIAEVSLVDQGAFSGTNWRIVRS